MKMMRNIPLILAGKKNPGYKLVKIKAEYRAVLRRLTLNRMLAVYFS
jgi:hypothetical protein